MAYTKTNWVNGQTPINATNLNHIEEGIYNIYNDLFPVGSIVIKADNNDYSNWLGFTWERTLVGRVAVGIDSTQTEFDTIGETGGSKYIQNHHHMGLGIADATFSAWSATGNGNIFDVANLFKTGEPNNNRFTSGNVEGNTGNSGNLQPYQVVAYWKRVS